MTMTRPSKSMSVTSMFVGMVFLTASLASSRIFSMPIYFTQLYRIGCLGRNADWRCTDLSRQFHLGKPLLDILLVICDESVLGYGSKTVSVPGCGISSHGGVQPSDRKIDAVVHRQALLVVILQHTVHVWRS